MNETTPKSKVQIWQRSNASKFDHIHNTQESKTTIFDCFVFSWSVCVSSVVRPVPQTYCYWPTGDRRREASDLHTVVPRVVHGPRNGSRRPTDAGPRSAAACHDTFLLPSLSAAAAGSIEERHEAVSVRALLARKAENVQIRMCD